MEQSKAMTIVHVDKDTYNHLATISKETGMFMHEVIRNLSITCYLQLMLTPMNGSTIQDRFLAMHPSPIMLGEASTDKEAAQ